MTDKNDELSNNLYHTRDALVDACYVLGLNPGLVIIDELSVQQCMECDIWERPGGMIADVCRFCNDMPDLRF